MLVNDSALVQRAEIIREKGTNRSQFFRGQIDASLEQEWGLRRPIVPQDCTHNAHMYYLLLHNLDQRSNFIEKLKQKGMMAVFHYVPLHHSPAGKRYGHTQGELPVTEELADRLVRLPLWVGIEEYQEEAIAEVIAALQAGEKCENRKPPRTAESVSPWMTGLRSLPCICGRDDSRIDIRLLLSFRLSP